MNYLAEILAFNNWIEFNSEINKSDICLWHALMHIANRFVFKEFSVPISKLILVSKLNKDNIYRSRNKLKQLKLIDFKERSGKQSAVYKMNSLVSQYETQSATQNAIQERKQESLCLEIKTQDATQSATQDATQSANINKTKNQKLKTKNQKYIHKQSAALKNRTAYGEFANVFLSECELKNLKSRFNDWGNRIELLSGYIASTGKKYKSHYATILNWSRKENNGESHRYSQQLNTKKLCTDYDEG